MAVGFLSHYVNVQYKTMNKNVLSPSFLINGNNGICPNLKWTIILYKNAETVSLWKVAQ